MSRSAESYLKPEVIQTVGRLDLRAKFIVEGFLQGLHKSPYQGFSVEFSEHRRYNPGDDVKDIDWLVFAKTDRYYVKKYEAETNITGYLLMDLSASMDFTHAETLTKFDYSICLAAALAYLMIHQQDPVGLMTFGESLTAAVPAGSKRSQLSNILAVLSKIRPQGETEVAGNLQRVAAMLRQKSLLMVFSDLLVEPEPVIKTLHQLRHQGHDVILFPVLDRAEVEFPFDGMVDFEDTETGENELVDASGIRTDYLEAVATLREDYQSECQAMGADYVPLHTGMPFDRALIEYLTQRQARF